jgi:uncharacterized membrane protein YdbT with pleckstrin-like domain
MEPPEEHVLFDGHPSWRSTPGLHIKGILAAVIAGAIAGLATAAANGHVQAGWVVVAVVLVFGAALLVGAIRRARTTYTITNERLMIQHGLLARSHQETRLERVQNVASRQSVLERLLGVGTVEFDTAGEAQYDFAFRGVANPREIVRAVDHALRERPYEAPRTRTWSHDV